MMNYESTEELLATLARTPVEIARLINDVPDFSVVIKPSPDEFSVLENVCHLRDIETEGYSVRIQRILAEDNPALADVDGARLAIERDYNKQDLNDALAAFTAARKQNVADFTNASAAEYERAGTLEVVGQITLRKLLEMMCQHDEGHVDEVRAIRAKLVRATEA